MRAAASLAESLQVPWVMGNRLSLSWCLDGLAAVAYARGLPERAARLCAAAEVMGVGPPGSPAVRAIHERTLASARAALGEDVFLAVWEAGHRLPPEQMIEEALHPLG